MQDFDPNIFADDVTGAFPSTESSLGRCRKINETIRWGFRVITSRCRASMINIEDESSKQGKFMTLVHRLYLRKTKKLFQQGSQNPAKFYMSSIPATGCSRQASFRGETLPEPPWPISDDCQYIHLEVLDTACGLTEPDSGSAW